MVDWDELASFAARLVSARSYEGVGDRCARARHPGEAIDRFAARRELSVTIAGRAGARAKVGEASIPEAVTGGLKHNQKPFHLWNVERAVHDPPAAFEPQPAVRLGTAAVLPEELRVPRRLKKATHVLEECVDSASMRDDMAKLDRLQFLQLLRRPLPFGRPEDPPAEGRTEAAPRRAGPPVPERVAPFVRAPGGMPRSRFDDDQDPDAPGFEPPPED